MFSKVVLATALLCLSQGFHISQTYISVVQNLQPKLNELTEVVEQLNQETETSLLSTKKYVSLKIQDANKAIQSKLAAIGEQTQQTDKKINVCLTNVKASVENIDVNAVRSIETLINWTSYEKQLSALNALKNEITVTPGTCLRQALLNPDVTRNCMEERIENIEQQAKGINEYITSAMSMIKSNIVKSVQDKVLEIFEAISNVNEELSVCIEGESEDDTFISVVEEIKPKVQELKENIEQLLEEAKQSIISTSTYADLKINEARNSVATKLTLLKEEMQIQPIDNACAKNKMLSIQQVDVNSLTTIKDQINWELYEGKLPQLEILVKETDSILFYTKCLAESKLDTALTVKCIEEKITSTEQQAKGLNNYIITSMSMVKNNIAKSVQIKLLELFEIISSMSSQLSACNENNSSNDLEAIVSEYTLQVEGLKRKIELAVSLSKNQLSKITLQIQESRNEASNVIDMQLIKLTEAVKIAASSQKNIANCMKNQETSMAKLGDSGVSECGQNQLQSLEKHISEMSTLIENALTGPAICAQKQGGFSTGLHLINFENINLELLQSCLEEILETTEASALEKSEEVKTMVQATEGVANNCINHAKSSAVQSIQGIVSTFNFCVEEGNNSESYESVVEELKPKVEELTKAIKQHSEESEKAIQSTSTYIDMKINDAINAVNSKLTLAKEQIAQQQTTKKVDNKINECLKSHEVALQEADVTVLTSIKEYIKWDLYEQRLSELKALVREAALIPGACIVKHNLDASLIRSCAENKIQEVEQQSTNINEYIISSMSMAQESIAKSIQVNVLEIFEIISNTSSEYSACIEETSSDETSINALNEQLTVLKTDVQKLSSDWSILLEEAQRNLNNKVQQAATDIQSHLAKIQEEKAANGDGSLSSIKLDLISLNSCTVSEDLEELSKQMTILVRIESSIAASTGFCSGQKDTLACLQKSVESAEIQIERITTQLSELYVNGLKTGTECVNNVKQEILSAIDFSEDSKNINALNEQLTQLKTNVQKFSADWSVLLEEAQRNLDNKVQKATSDIKSHLAKIQEEQAANGDGSFSAIKLNLNNLNACAVSEDLQALSNQMTILVRIESSIAASSGFCSGQKDTVACLEKSVESAEIQIERITAQLSELYVSGLKTGAECVNNAKQDILSVIDSSEDSKNINALNEQLTQLKTNVQKFSADWSVLLEEAQRNLDNKVQKATSDIKSHLAKIQEEQAANGDGSFSAIKLNLNNLNACAVSEDLQALSNQMTILVRIESSIAASSGFCSGQKDTVACLEKSVESAEIQIERITAQLSEMYVSGLKTGSECVNNAKQQILSVIDSSEESKNINALNEKLSQLKSNVQELSADWSILLEDAQRNLNNKVQQAASDIQSYLTQIQEEKAANSDGSLSIIKLDFKNLNSCAVSEDLQALSKQMSLLVRIESTIASSSGFCTSQKETVTCLEKSVDSAEIQIETILSQLTELYVSGLKTGAECVNNVQQHLLSIIQLIH